MTIIYGNFIEKFEHPRWDKQWEHQREHHKNIIKKSMCKLKWEHEGNIIKRSMCKLKWEHEGNIIGNTWKEQQISSPSLDEKNF
jgi:hypothetical protein